MPAEKQVMILFAGAFGYLDEVPVESVSEYEKQMLEFVGTKHPEVLKEIKEKGIISDELEGKMKKALDQLKGMFQPASQA
jgi:F-type H+-transporting ATPase subunit alpha